MQYSKDGGFKITHWPSFDYLTKAIDFIKTLQQLSSQGSAGCGSLANFAYDNLITSKFNVGVSFSTGSSSLSLVISGTYTLSFAGAALTGNGIQFPGMLSVPLPNSAKLSDLGTYIDQALAGAAESFVRGLLNNSEAIAKLIALTAGTQAAKYAATLLCQNLIGEAAADAVASSATSAAASAATDMALEASVSAPDRFAIAVAKARAGEAAGKGAAIAHQAFGAMGFTREHQLQYATRRLWSWRDEFGGEAYWQTELGRTIAANGADSALGDDHRDRLEVPENLRARSCGCERGWRPSWSARGSSRDWP
ncbi:MAG: hypothetical protein HC872_00190 [Gammaproteobacteria bacterium]|nr:hypothetical protein [Gammaproteobacteria bacterium]